MSIFLSRNLLHDGRIPFFRDEIPKELKRDLIGLAVCGARNMGFDSLDWAVASAVALAVLYFVKKRVSSPLAPVAPPKAASKPREATQNERNFVEKMKVRKCVCLLVHVDTSIEGRQELHYLFWIANWHS